MSLSYSDYARWQESMLASPRGEELGVAVAAAVALATRAVQRGRGVIGAFEDGD